VTTEDHPQLLRAFVPAHITAFFVPVFEEEPLRTGSLGAGVNLDRGTTVFMSIEENGAEWMGERLHVAFNGEPVSRDDAVISYSVAEKLMPDEFDGEIEIWQYFDFPNGCGFGNSAGGALGTALTFGLAFGRTLLDVARVAHVAEVENGGGLGDVVAQLAGGIEIRIRAGGPGIGVVDNVLSPDLKVVSVHLGPIRTRDLLDEEVVDVIKKEGVEALNRLTRDPRVPVMMELSRKFAERTGLMDDELVSLAREMDRVVPFRSSMIMLGRGIFSFVREGDLPAVEGLLNDLDVPHTISNVYRGKPLVSPWRTLREGSPT